MRDTLEIRDLRRLYRVYDVLDISPRKRWIVCPLPQHVSSHEHEHERTPSFSIFQGREGEDRFKCHGNCGGEGDVVDLAGYLWVPGYDPRSSEDVAKAISALQTRGEVVLPSAQPEPVSTPTLDPSAHRDFLPIGPRAKRYANQRGISDEAIEHFQLGSARNKRGETHLTIPSFEEGVLRGVKKRALWEDPDYKYVFESGSKMALFNYDAVAYKNGPVFLVKAEIPVLVLWGHGFQACAVTTGEGSWHPRFEEVLAPANVTVIGDNDEPGIKFATRRATDLRAKLRFPPKEYKDVDEWILAEGNKALRTLEEWRLEL